MIISLGHDQCVNDQHIEVTWVTEMGGEYATAHGYGFEKQGLLN
jgi:hypothetical protein